MIEIAHKQRLSDLIAMELKNKFSIKLTDFWIEDCPIELDDNVYLANNDEDLNDPDYKEYYLNHKYIDSVLNDSSFKIDSILGDIPIVKSS